MAEPTTLVARLPCPECLRPPLFDCEQVRLAVVVHARQHQ